MVQAVSRRPLTTKGRYQASPHEIDSGQNDAETSSCPISPVSPVSIIPPKVHNVAFTNWTNGRTLATVKKGMLFWKLGNVGKESTFDFCVFTYFLEG
jgi:hypothetical protein